MDSATQKHYSKVTPLYVDSKQADTLEAEIKFSLGTANNRPVLTQDDYAAWRESQGRGPRFSTGAEELEAGRPSAGAYLRAADKWARGPLARWFRQKFIDDKDAVRRMGRQVDAIRDAVRRLGVMTRASPEAGLLGDGIGEVAEAVRDFLYEFRTGGLEKRVREKLEDALVRLDALSDEISRRRGSATEATRALMAGNARAVAGELGALMPRPAASEVTTAGLEDVTARLRGSVTGVVAAMLGRGMVDFSGQTTGPALMAAVDGLGRQGVLDLNRYLKAKRALAVWNDPRQPGRNPSVPKDEAEKTVTGLRLQLAGQSQDQGRRGASGPQCAV
jgi:hypothetical protein